jgi:hypothetical protein
MLLLAEADPECDSEILAETLLAALGAEVFTYLRRARGMSLERVKQGWREQVRRTVVASEPGPVVVS